MRSFNALTPMLFSASGVAIVTVVYLHWSVNPTTVALSYLLLILLIATRWGIAEATVASVLAILCFNLAFLPPVGTLTIVDPQNWISFFAFMATAMIASQLSGRARQRTIDSIRRQEDLERLYALSRALLLSEAGSSTPAMIAQRIAATFDARAVALYDHQTDTISRAGAIDVPELDNKLRAVARQALSQRDPSGAVITAIRLGGAPVGSLAMLGPEPSDTVLQSIANLAAIAIERAVGEQIAARAEAARESSELRATILDAVAHEFKTPLTSMKAATGDLLSNITSAREHELVAIVDEELDRLQALVTDAVQMLRVDSGDFAVNRVRGLLAPLVEAALQHLRTRLVGHHVVNEVPVDLTVDADRNLLEFALRQLLDNAVKYSPADSAITIGAVRNRGLEIAVHNSGPAIPERELPKVFDRFFRGGAARRIPGTGMGLAIVRQVAHAHGGTLTVTSTDEAGTAFTLYLPEGAAAS